MLDMLAWIVPESTQKTMSPADWLMTVLSIYFHDLGMLVTREEFNNRQHSEFPAFKHQIMNSTDSEDTDYRARIRVLNNEDVERFLYQEFIRKYHAKRIRSWISGQEDPTYGVSTEAAREVAHLLEPLGPLFRDDLALVCESHHLDDLEDIEKYPVSQPYGNSAASTANIQYAAILLRTVDLLHITLDRTPPISFRIINPQDPISQREWAKQMAVQAVRAQPKRNEAGDVDTSLVPDTIEVYAVFENQEGFFALTSYLRYASSELQRSHEWAVASNKRHQAPHLFPWQRVDDAHVKAKGFLPQPFHFGLDEARILDLLTGHTLYNDTTVVLREIVQNSLDAVRLQLLEDRRPASDGEVFIHWNSRSRTLEVRDNGTGMTQEIIENHLLKVGSSRYQDPKFQERHPEFSPISRFGIGVLSTFMISDAVEIITLYESDDSARHLSLRSVHGKYLVRLLSKTDPAAKQLAPHGTLVRLNVRPSANVEDLVDLARRWVVIPGCRVVATIDDNPPVTIGFESPADALKEALVNDGLLSPDSEAESEDAGSEDQAIKIEQRQRGGLTMAYALRWSKFFNEWNFVPCPRDSELTTLHRQDLGTCVEGIRVEFGSPGFDDAAIYAIANATGRMAPRTNVARSGLEPTPEYETLLHSIYAIYVDQVRKEIQNLHQSRSYSLTWATREATFLMAPILTGQAGRAPSRVVSQGILEEELRSLPAFIIEERGSRASVSLNELGDGSFYTIENVFLNHAENVIKEIRANASLSGILSGLQAVSFELPKAPLLCLSHTGGTFKRMLMAQYEPSEILADKVNRRVDVKWVRRSRSPMWTEAVSRRRDSPIWFDNALERLDTALPVRKRRLYGSLHIPLQPLPAPGFDDEAAVVIDGRYYLLPGTTWADELARAYRGPGGGRLSAAFLSAALLATVVLLLPHRLDLVELFEERIVPILRRSAGMEEEQVAALLEKGRSAGMKVLDVEAWQRGADPSAY
jgi:hypothetical protein